MKTRILFLFSFFLAAIALSPSASAERLFKDISSTKGVQTVYVGKALIRMGASMDIDGVGPVADKLDSVEVVNADEKNAVKIVRQALKRVVDQYGLEVLTETVDDDETVVIYGKENGNILKIIVIAASEPDEISVVAMTGNIPADKLSEMVDDM